MNGEIRKRFTAFKIPIGLIAKASLNFEKKQEQAEQSQSQQSQPTQPAQEQEQQRFRSLSLNEKEIVRVNIIANVIDKYNSQEKAYSSITIDDGTGNLRIKTFSDNIKLLENIEPGHTILAIGMLRYFNNELYILPEIIKTLDPRWLLVRKLELTKEFGELYTSIVNQKEKQEEQWQGQQMQQKQQLQSEVTKEEITEEKIESENKDESVPSESSESSEPSLREQVLELVKKAEEQRGIDIDKLIMSLSQPTEEINKTITTLLEEGTIYEPKPGCLRIL